MEDEADGMDLAGVRSRERGSRQNRRRDDDDDDDDDDRRREDIWVR